MDYLRSYKNIYDQNIILLYKGELTFDLVTSMIATLEERLEELEENRKVKKKFYNVATECVQNLYYHLDEVTTDEMKISSYDSQSALILIAARKRFYSLQTGNYVPTDKVEEIKARLDEINSVNPDELRDLYKKALNEQEFSEKGTGGLGFIDIARKTGGQKLRYKFQEVTDKISYFTLQVRLPREI
ncbi:SiaB family protein kinase [Marinoscillum sp. MHG1-6]|uniref:SiaB family protein kinase n=1 Tax=Marinoscillum sp. MHG1-6 TaxID=2959627 RepID=UPI0021572133|nr:SiaB family protein kinase [Marinoscillum sp. MHG1-6]